MNMGAFHEEPTPKPPPDPESPAGDPPSDEELQPE